MKNERGRERERGSERDGKEREYKECKRQREITSLSVISHNHHHEKAGSTINSTL